MRVRHLIQDVAVAATAGGLQLLVFVTAGVPTDRSLLLTAPALLLIARRRFPLAVLSIVAIAAIAATLRATTDLLNPAVAVAFYSLGAHGRGRVRLAIAAVWAVALLWVQTSSGTPETASVVVNVVDIGVQFAGLVGLLGLGRFVAGRDARLELVEQRAAALEGERVAVAKLAAAEERTRIAREIHDIAGQSVGVMIVGARGARDAVRERPADAERILDLLEQSAQRSLDDLRQSVGMLRSVAEPAERHPTPGIEAVDALVTEMRAAGLRVALRRDEDLRDDALSPVVALSAYRIVQEGLANALRHAPASSVEVRLARHGRTLDVEVDDDGADAPPVVVGPGGHGLLGMRERASLVGGNVEAGPRPDGGFRVRARLPIEGVA